MCHGIVQPGSDVRVFGNFDAKDEPRSGQPVADKVDAISEKVGYVLYESAVSDCSQANITHRSLIANEIERSRAKLWPTWLQHANGPAGPARHHTLIEHRIQM
ncbi:hypothetical protein EVAR_5902_1 [Eumeta japonica]|uniref:Uncharacterized protein n=1 Tax=Eumeta variegata TaxID=151549 RepID=A0A4C1TFJ5_EUMVA|nr:hypothetical protein EVAR_5902_1 [Eumeta japonica]